MNIYIVEDDSVLQLMLGRMIAKMGHTISGTATRGAEAIKEIIELKPDVILMDILLKDDIDGISVVSDVSGVLPINVIYITGNSDFANRERAKKYGYHDYLTKPITYSDLEDSINRLNLKNQ